MSIDKEKAVELRRSGLSYKQIHKATGVSLGTLTGWFKNQAWSQDIKKRLSAAVSLSNPKVLKIMAEANRERWKTKYEEYRILAVNDFKKYKDNPLFLSGVMLYWGEGEKQQKTSLVSLGNSDPEMIKIFNRFLIEICGISREKIKLNLVIYPDLVDSVQKNLWSRLTGIPLSSFNKSSVIKGRHPTKRNSYGVCLIRVSSRGLKEKLLTWIKLYQDNFRLV